MDVLKGCPGAAHFLWWLRAWTPCTPPTSELEAEHVALSDGLSIETPLPGFHMVRTTERAVGRVLGWRTSRFGYQVVTYQGADGRTYDLVADLDPVTGRLAHPAVMPSINGIDLSIQGLGELGAADVARLHGLFEAAYTAADHNYLDWRFASLNTVITAWSGQSAVGFSAYAIGEVDLPCVGHRTFSDGGITCIHPSAQGRSIGLAFGTSWRLFDGVRPELALNHFATPVTLHAMLRVGSYQWPGNDISTVATALTAATPCQRAVGAEVARRAGAISYDATRWVLRTGHPAGETTTKPTGLDPLYTKIFEALDRTKGDTLLGVFWTVEPPAVWFDSGPGRGDYA